MIGSLHSPSEMFYCCLAGIVLCSTSSHSTHRAYSARERNGTGSVIISPGDRATLLPLPSPPPRPPPPCPPRAQRPCPPRPPRPGQPTWTCPGQRPCPCRLARPGQPTRPG